MLQTRGNFEISPKKVEHDYKGMTLAVLVMVAVILFLQIIRVNSDKNEERTANLVPTSPIVSPTTALMPTIGKKTTPTPTASQLSGQTTPTLTTSPTPTPPVSVYKSSKDRFEVTYKTLRTTYEDISSGANRYTFYLSTGSNAIHVGNQWAWLHPRRDFSNGLTVDGHNTFVYETSDQKIVDIENGNKKYTIQCIHNGITGLRAECEEFIKSFRFVAN